MTKNVYQLIAEVSGRLAKEGIAKEQKNAAQGYRFRGIDDVMNALSPLLAEAGLVILPRAVLRETTERENKNGGTLMYTVVQMEFDFVSSHDGSKHTMSTYGEAMDSGDKATNKAMSAAYKYAAFQTFCIPTEGDNDADATTHEVAPSKQSTFANAQRAVLAAKTPEQKKLVSDKITANKDLTAEEKFRLSGTLYGITQ